MPRKLFVHVGPRKTATSTIQRFLAQHDNSVVIYPKTGVLGQGKYNGHHGTVFKFFGEAKANKHSADDIEKTFEAISDEVRKGDQNVVISSEILQSRDIGAFVRALLSHIRGTDLEVEFLVACREHFSRTASWYNHKLRATGETRTPDEFLVGSGDKMCYEPFIGELRETGFKVTALNYHPSENWVQRFLIYLGFREDQLTDIKSELVAFSPKLMVVNLAVKTLSGSKKTQQECMKPFKSLSDPKSPSQFIFTRQAAEIAEQWFAPDRKFLFDEFGISLVPPDFQSKENAFLISNEEFSEIKTAAETLGKKGRRIADYVRQFVHPV